MAESKGIIREQQALITVAIDGKDLGPNIIGLAGGQAEADVLKVFPGGMRPQIAIGGSVQRENITVRILFDDYARSLFSWLDDRTGCGEFVVGYQPLDCQGNQRGTSITYRGVLQRVTRPDYDSASNDAAVLELEGAMNAQLGS